MAMDAKEGGSLKVCVRELNDQGGRVQLRAWVRLFEEPTPGTYDAGPAEGPSDRTPRRRRESAQPSQPPRAVSAALTGDDGCIEFRELRKGEYYAIVKVGEKEITSDRVTLDEEHQCPILNVTIETGFDFGTFITSDECLPVRCEDIERGKGVMVQADIAIEAGEPELVDFDARFLRLHGGMQEQLVRPDRDSARAALPPANARRFIRPGTGAIPGMYPLKATMEWPDGTRITGVKDINVRENVQQVSGDISVTLRRTAAELTEDLPLWIVIRNSTNALSFNNYAAFLDQLFCGDRNPTRAGSLEDRQFNGRVNAFRNLSERRYLPYTDSDAYRVLKVATEAFVMVNCGVFLPNYPFSDEDREYVLRKVGLAPDLAPFWRRYLESVNGYDDATLPYLALVRQKLRDVSVKTNLFDNPKLLPPRRFEECSGILAEKLTSPCLLELIWSYWHEEGMLVQTLNAVTRRFQNVRISAPGLDPLANFEVDPLRPLGNLLWAYTQDEQHRLSVVRRNYEYDHEYGLRLEGKAVGDPRTADARSKFLEAFHNLLHRAAQFYKQDDNTTIVADGFPVLNALKEVHLILAEGAHNQFGDLPSTARIEMLMQQWLLARPEFREFLPTRVMVAYPEAWMDRVDAMKRLQGWTDTNVLNFRNLGVFGEQLLLSIRYGNWSSVHDAAQGANWARFWRPEVQGYVHAYQAVSGIDHSVIAGDARVDATLPSTLLRRRLAAQQQQHRS